MSSFHAFSMHPDEQMVQEDIVSLVVLSSLQITATATTATIHAHEYASHLSLTAAWETTCILEWIHWCSGMTLHLLSRPDCLYACLYHETRSNATARELQGNEIFTRESESGMKESGEGKAHDEKVQIQKERERERERERIWFSNTGRRAKWAQNSARMLHHRQHDKCCHEDVQESLMEQEGRRPRLMLLADSQKLQVFNFYLAQTWPSSSQKLEQKKDLHVSLSPFEFEFQVKGEKSRRRRMCPFSLWMFS